MSRTSHYLDFLPHLLPTSHTQVKGAKRVDRAIYSAISGGWQALSRQAGIKDHRFMSFKHGEDHLTTDQLARLAQDSSFIHLVHYATSVGNWVHVTPRGVIVSPSASNGASLLSLEPGSDQWTVHGTLGDWEFQKGKPALAIPGKLAGGTARKVSKWLNGGGERFLKLGENSPSLESFLLVNGLKAELLKGEVLLSSRGFFQANLSRETRPA